MEVKISKGIHESEYGEHEKKIFLMFGGVEYERLWSDDMTAEPFLVSPMLDDMMINTQENEGKEPKFRAAMEEYCLRTISNEYGCITMGKVQQCAFSFWSGWDEAKQQTFPKV